MTTQLTGRYVVRVTDLGVRVEYHDRPLTRDERECPAAASALSDRGREKCRAGGGVTFTENDEGYAAVAAPLYDA